MKHRPRWVIRIWGPHTAEDQGYLDELWTRKSDALRWVKEWASDDFAYNLEPFPGYLYVNVYIVYQNCGGPEEGGWYYYSGEPVESVRMATEAQARAVHRWKCAEWEKENEGRPPLHSVASYGRYEVKLEWKKGESWPTHTPRYE